MHHNASLIGVESNERNRPVAEGDSIHGHVAVGFRAFHIHVFVIQEQEHKQPVSFVLFFEHHFVQHVDLLQRADE